MFQVRRYPRELLSLVHLQDELVGMPLIHIKLSIQEACTFQIMQSSILDIFSELNRHLNISVCHKFCALTSRRARTGRQFI